MIVVRLDDARYGAGPGTVIAHVETVSEFIRFASDRDGARSPALRLWDGDTQIGDRVMMAEPSQRTPAANGHSSP